MNEFTLGKEIPKMEENQSKLEHSTEINKENLSLMQTGERKQKNECLNGEKSKKSVHVPSYVTPDSIIEIKPEDKSIHIEKETFNSFREWFKTIKERDYQKYIQLAKTIKEREMKEMKQKEYTKVSIFN